MRLLGRLQCKRSSHRCQLSASSMLDRQRRLGIVWSRFRQGLKETGFVEGDNVTIAYRWAENRTERLPELAADLVRLQTAVITTAGPPAAFAAKAATTTIPSLFIVADDPVLLGLVTSLGRPAGNLTGINLFNSELAAKRLALLHELVPQAKRVAVLVDPADAANTASTLREIDPASRAIGFQIT